MSGVSEELRPEAATFLVRLADCVRALAFSPDGTRLAAASLGGEVVIVDLRGGGSRVLARPHAGGALALAWTPTGDAVVTGGQDGAVVRHRLDRDVTDVLHEGPGWVERVAWAPDGRVFAAAIGRAVRFFDADGVALPVVHEHDSTVSDIAWGPEPGVLWSGCYGGVQALSPTRVRALRRLRWKGSILAIAPSPDGRWLATGNQDASVHIWHLASGRDFEMSGFPAKVRTLRFRPDAQSLATASGGAVALWDFAGRGPAGRTPKVLEGHAATITDAAFVDAGGRVGLVTTALDGTLRSWLPARSRSAVSSVDLGSPASCLAVHARTAGLAVGTRDGAVRVSPGVTEPKRRTVSVARR